MLAQPSTEPACHADARELLLDHGITVTRIIRVEPDAILYLGGRRQPMTAWLTMTPKGLEVAYQAGFPIEPAAGLTPRSTILTRADAADDLQDQA